MEIKETAKVSETVWKDRKRPIFGLPLSFTKYELNKEKLLVTTGIFSTNEEEVKLYRILDVILKKSFLQRIFGVGTIHCCSADKSTPEFDIKDIKNAFEVKELLSSQIEKEREAKRVMGREYMASDEDDDVDDD